MQCAWCASTAFSSSMASRDSKVAPARTPTQGSCRPLASWNSISSRSLRTEFWGWAMVAVGLKLKRHTSGIPVVTPPSRPPWLLLWYPLVRMGSLCSLPRHADAARPEPISQACTACRPPRLPMRRDFRLWYRGSPTRGGTLTATTSSAAPMESCSLRVLAISAAAWRAKSASTARSGPRSRSLSRAAHVAADRGCPLASPTSLATRAARKLPVSSGPTWQIEEKMAVPKCSAR